MGELADVDKYQRSWACYKTADSQPYSIAFDKPLQTQLPEHEDGTICVHMKIVAAPSEWCRPVQNDKVLSPDFKLEVRTTTNCSTTISYTVQPCLLNQDNESEIELGKMPHNVKKVMVDDVSPDIGPMDAMLSLPSAKQHRSYFVHEGEERKECVVFEQLKLSNPSRNRSAVSVSLGVPQIELMEISMSVAGPSQLTSTADLLLTVPTPWTVSYLA
eukprot:jgi/Ulvmu1/5374/UM022_0169.1